MQRGWRVCGRSTPDRVDVTEVRWEGWWWWCGGGGEEKKKSKDSTNNLYNYHHLLLFLPGKETLHPFVAIARGNVTSKLIITIKISFSARGRQ